MKRGAFIITKKGRNKKKGNLTFSLFSSFPFRINKTYNTFDDLQLYRDPIRFKKSKTHNEIILVEWTG